MQAMGESAKASVCPHCGSTEIRAILHGLPTRDGWRMIRRGEVGFGGCHYTPGADPDCECQSCGHGWADPELARQYKQERERELARIIGRARRKQEKKRRNRAKKGVDA